MLKIGLPLVKPWTMITLNFDKFIKELMLGWRKSAVEDLYDYNIIDYKCYANIFNYVW